MPPRTRNSGSSGSRRISFGAIAWGAIVVLATIFGVLQGPKAVVDLHELMCGSSSWQGLAGRFSDCASYASKQYPPGAAVGVVSTDPLEIITRRGYTPDHQSVYRAISLGRREDVDLLLKAGAKINVGMLQFVTVSPEWWRWLVERGAIEDGPCSFSVPDLDSHDFFLRGVMDRRNGPVYKSLCNGKYLAAVKAALAKARADYEKQLSDARAAIAKRDVAIGKAIATCRAGLDAALPNSAQLKDRFLCAAMKINTEQQRTARATACANGLPLERSTKAVEDRLRSLGHLSATPFNPGYDCVQQGFCMMGAATKVAGEYFEMVVRDKQPEDGATWRSRRAQTIEKHCTEFFESSADTVYRNKFELPKFRHADLFDRFEKATAER